MIPLLLRGWSVGAMVLDKLSVPGRPTKLEESTALAVGAGGYYLDNFFLPSIFSLFFLPLW